MLVLGHAERTLESSGVTVDTRQFSAAQVIGHRDQMRRVVSYLLDNAVRHAASIVTVTLGEAEGVVTFAVIDDGPGIPPAQRIEVFERFRRPPGRRGGTGLGLAIVRDLVNRHSGTMTTPRSAHVDAGADRGERRHDRATTARGRTPAGGAIVVAEHRPRLGEQIRAWVCDVERDGPGGDTNRMGGPYS